MAERQEQLQDIIAIAIDNALANLHTVAIVKVVLVGEKTIDCKPVTNRVVNGKSVKLPVFSEVPPIIMNGGSNYIALPISEGDYGLLIITERCYDRWYNGQDFIEPLEMRMHDYSDGFALIGINPAKAMVSIPGSDTVINGPMALGSPTASDALALASKVQLEFQNIVTAISTAATSPAPDGGAAFKTNLLANLSGLGVPNNVGSSKIKAE